MKMILFIGISSLTIAGSAYAQAPDPHAGHAMAAQPTDPHAGHSKLAPAAADPHAGHNMATPAADPHAGHAMPVAPADPHAGHTMPAAPAVDAHAGHNMATPAAEPHAGHAMPAAPADPHAGHTMPAAPAVDPHAGHNMTTAADPHAGHAMPATPVDPHAGHTMPSAPAVDPHAGHNMATPDPHAGHNMPSAAAIGNAPAPPVPTDHAADLKYPPATMAAARAQLRKEHGDIRYSKFILETAEYRPSDDGDSYAWEGQFSWGGDINRLVLSSEGEGEVDHGLESMEVQALYSRAITPYFNLQAGVRHDFEPEPQRTYATVGIEGLAPYWFEIGGALFLSDEGEVSARLEGSYDFRITQKLVLEPRAELNIFASDDEEREVGSGISDLEVGLRLRYLITPEFAPYVGVTHERKLGQTADFARAHHEEVEDTRFVVGLRTWF